MLFSEDWLRSYINPDLTTEELAESLTMAGLEVEEVQKIAPDFTGVVVGHVLECVDHENSDHLHVTKVDVGNGEILQIVCGAPNVRAGLKVACAKIGAVLPEFKIKKAKMRGVESFGMLCSARELGVSSDHTAFGNFPPTPPWVKTSARCFTLMTAALKQTHPQPRRRALGGGCRARPARGHRCSPYDPRDARGGSHLQLHRTRSH